MAEHRPAADATGAARPSQSPSHGVIYWRYLIFWLLLFSLMYFVSLYGIVAEA